MAAQPDTAPAAPARPLLPAPLSPESGARLNAVAAAAYAREPVGALTVGVVRDGRLVWTASYGTVDAATGTPARTETIYRVASVTKEFTALMLLRLVNEGVVHLSDPVAKYVPEISRIRGALPGAAPVTLIELATHTSGLAVESDAPASYTQGAPTDWEATLLAALPHTHFASEPGVRYAYSNVDYAILALALSRAARTSYVDYLGRRVFRPLGMTHTGFLAPTRPGALARGYVMRAGLPDGELPERELAGRGYKVPSGGAFSTVEDLARFLAFEMGYGPETVLPKVALSASRDLLVAGNARLDGGYGVGFQIFPAHGQVMLGHLGGIAGYRSLVAFDPESRTGVIVLRSVSEGEIDPLALGEALIRTARDLGPATIPVASSPAGR